MYWRWALSKEGGRKELTGRKADGVHGHHLEVSNRQPNKEPPPPTHLVHAPRRIPEPSPGRCPPDLHPPPDNIDRVRGRLPDRARDATREEVESGAVLAARFGGEEPREEVLFEEAPDEERRPRVWDDAHQGRPDPSVKVCDRGTRLGRGCS